MCPEAVERFVAIAREHMPFTKGVDALAELCVALEAMHGEGIIHRDLEPDNVFLVSIRGGRHLAS